MSGNAVAIYKMDKVKQSSDKILELASLVSRSKKPVKVYPVPILLEVNSLLASYTIPGMRVEGTTYDVPTFSALKGAMESIYKHPGAEMIPTAVFIHSPIKKERMLLRNEKHFGGMRSRECLTNVRYTIVAYLVETDDMRNPNGLTWHFKDFLQYAKNGCGREFPYLGTMEAPMYFRPITEMEIKPTQPIARDLGFMPLTPDYTKKYDPDLVCRHLTIENGVIEYTKGAWFRCYESSVSAG